jgi:Protein kinase domain
VSPAPATGQQFGAYQLGDVLGRGGMGVVFRAEHMHLGRMVALKVLAPELSQNADFRARFLRESRMAAALDHPNAVTVYDAGDIDGSLYLAMRLVPGEDLSNVLRQRGPLAPDEALDALEQVAAALDAAHAAGLVHRDVKPANVLVDGERCYLTDFGLTKATQTNATAMTATGVFLGTPDYAAPEQISASHVDGRADVYALGGVLYECLTGSRPFPRDSSVAVIYAHLHDVPPRPSEVRSGLPGGLDDVVACAMAKAPSHRYATCGALIAAARAALSQRETAAAPPMAATQPAPAAPTPPAAPPPTAATAALEAPSTPPAPQYTPARRRSRGPLVGLVAAGAVVLAIVAVVALGGGGDDGGESSGGVDSSDNGGDSAPSARVAGDPISVGSRPFGVAFAGGQLWVANNSDNTVTRVAPDGSGSTAIDVDDKPFGVTATADAVWVVQTGSDSVLRIDASTSDSAPADAGDEPYFAAADGGSVYVASGGDGTVTELDAATGRPRREPIEVGGTLRGIAAADGVVWVADKDTNSVKRIQDGRVDRTLLVGRNPVDVAIGGGALWVANKDSGTVSRVELEGGETRETRIGDEPFGVAFGEGFAWATSGADDTVTRLDPETGRRSGRRVRVPGQPTGVTVADGSVWVTANDAATLTRIDPVGE